jgi:HPt (histidine-containing phosphotransfer) domain-containing protein
MAFGIPGVDEEKFFDLFDNDMELYIIVLRTFVTSTPSTLDKLRNVSQETLPNYATHIHGVKGTTTNIGAEEARQKAIKLEAMAKAGDFSGVQAGNEAFLKYMDDLLDNLKNWIDNYKG